MIVSTHQPVFSPWLGFFHKLSQCDLLVLLDDVQFPHGTTWISRNRFKYQHGSLWLTVPVWKKGKPWQRINEVEICLDDKWPVKHRRSLEHAYKHAPYWQDHNPFWEILYQRMPQRLLDLNLAIIEYLKTHLMISTPVQLSSSLGIRADLTGNERLVGICSQLGASTYLAQPEARNFIQEPFFNEAGIKVEYARFHHPVYPQLWGGFIPNLSAWDLLFNCGPRSGQILNYF